MHFSVQEWEEELIYFGKMKSRQYGEEEDETCMAKINAVYGEDGDYCGFKELMNHRNLKGIPEFLSGTLKTVSCQSVSDAKCTYTY